MSGWLPKSPKARRRLYLVAAIAPVAGAEWKRYYDDVTWDPDEAKRRTKDDPTKPEVEL